MSLLGLSIRELKKKDPIDWGILMFVFFLVVVVVVVVVIVVFFWAFLHC